MNYVYPFTAIFKCGATIVVNNVDELRGLVTQYGKFGFEWIETEYSRRFRYNPFAETYPYNYAPTLFTPTYFEWIVRDDFGQKVDYDRIDFNWPKRSSWWYRGRQEAQRKAAERGEPIPHIRSHRRTKRKYPKNGRRGVAARASQGKDLFIKSKNIGNFDE